MRPPVGHSTGYRLQVTSTRKVR